MLKSIDSIYKVFAHMNSDLRKDGLMDHFVCDFIQDVYGRFHFIKIADYRTDGKPVQGEDWIMSSKLKENDNRKMRKLAENQVCNAKILCAQQDLVYKKSKVFWSM